MCVLVHINPIYLNILQILKIKPALSHAFTKLIPIAKYTRGRKEYYLRNSKGAGW